MAVLGLSFKKLSVERKISPKGQLNVTSNTNITNIEKSKMELESKDQEAVKFGFEFVTDYQPNVAVINVVGEVLWLDSKERIKDIMNAWKAKTKVPQQVMIPVLNTILSRANITALILSREMGLPVPLQLPRVEQKPEQAE
ncbi:hypothetical protein HZA97_02225 [Candidatus Woesearchaeota archaeon]|nr:hypothetical protein [Candidatus Woesearchaeota archaeon]